MDELEKVNISAAGGKSNKHRKAEMSFAKLKLFYFAKLCKTLFDLAEKCKTQIF